MSRIVIIIPAFNEALAIGNVLADLAGLTESTRVTEVIVVDNGSSDETAAVARGAGATVLHEPRKGYGQACLTGMAYAAGIRPDIVVFLDGDYSDHPDELPLLVQPILQGEADFVLGSRLLGERESGAMLPQALLGNRLASLLMRWIWGARFTDLGPFRAIRYVDLMRLGMDDRNFGWTIEMQLRASEAGLRCLEVPVSYRRRIGQSKVTGTVSGTLRASVKILWTIARFGATRGRRVYADARLK